MIGIEQIDNLLRHSGAVTDQSGDHVGKVEQVFIDDESGQPDWVTVKTGLFGHSETFIPLREASMDGENIRVPYEKNRLKDAPRIDGSSGHVDPEQEADLYRYYGLEPASAQSSNESRGSPGSRSGQGRHSDAGSQGGEADAGTQGRHSDAGSQGGGPGVGGGQDQSGSETRASEGVRLRKYTVTENVTMTVPVEREYVEVLPEEEPPDHDAQAAGKEDPYNSEAHGRHPEQG